ERARKPHEIGPSPLFSAHAGGAFREPAHVPSRETRDALGAPLSFRIVERGEARGARRPGGARVERPRGERPAFGALFLARPPFPDHVPPRDPASDAARRAHPEPPTRSEERGVGKEWRGGGRQEQKRPYEIFT